MLKYIQIHVYFREGLLLSQIHLIIMLYSPGIHEPHQRGEAINKGGTEGFELTRLSHSKPQTATKGLLWISRNQFC